MTQPGNSLDDIVRRNDPDRWLSSRFIGDLAARADVISLYAFDYELSRASRVTTNPLMGEIRLTWWREVLDEVFLGRAVRAHPTAEALAAVVRRHDLPRGPLEAMIDGRYRELDSDPMTPEEALSWALDTAGGAAGLVVRCLDPACPPQAAEAAGTLWALARKGHADPQLVRRAKSEAGRLSAAAFPAVAHAALALRPAASELSKRLRLTWAVARGRL